MRRECYKDVGRIFDDFRHKKKKFLASERKKFRAKFFSYDASASRTYARRPRPIRANEIRLGEIVTRVVLELLRRGAGCDPDQFSCRRSNCDERRITGDASAPPSVAGALMSKRRAGRGTLQNQVIGMRRRGNDVSRRQRLCRRHAPGLRKTEGPGIDPLTRPVF